jgi:two-component system LytT family sensor kinase
MLKNLDKKSIKSNLKEIRNISFVVSGIVAILVFSFLYLMSPNSLLLTGLTSLITLLYMLLNSYTMYKIFIFCSYYFSDQVLKFRVYRFLLSYLSGFVIFVLIYLGTCPLTNFESGILLKYYPVFIVESIIFTTLIMIFHGLVFVQFDRNKTKLENANLKIKSAEAANLLLKQQIHPHFLFNSLHTIKVLYKDDLLLGEEYLVQLADFLRTAISNTKAISASFEEELALFENYLNLQKMRFGDALSWQINIADEESLSIQIPAFFLQPLAENAIKHNYFSKKQPLIISVEQIGNIVIVSNGINKKKYVDTSIGTGLLNISERYQIFSGNELGTEDDGSIFKVSFKLK